MKELGNNWVLASGNAGKLREFQQVFDGLEIQLRAQSAFAVVEVEETGTTFVENAILKARAAARIAQRPALADDSGLRVASLNGRPGVYSARFAGEDASDAQNIERLLTELDGVADRSAQFCCALVLLRHADDPLPLIVQATWPGTIVDEPQGDGGFGYDPVFFVPDCKCTSAELDRATKNRLSHRGQAIKLLLAQLEHYR